MEGNKYVSSGQEVRLQSNPRAKCTSVILGEGGGDVRLYLPPGSIELMGCWVSHKLVKGWQRRGEVYHLQS